MGHDAADSKRNMAMTFRIYQIMGVKVRRFSTPRQMVS